MLGHLNVFVTKVCDRDLKSTSKNSSWRANESSTCRSKAIIRVTLISGNLKNSCVFVKGGANGATKSQNDAVQFVTPETERLLKEYIRGKMPIVQLFPMPDKAAEIRKAQSEGEISMKTVPPDEAHWSHYGERPESN